MSDFFGIEYNEGHKSCANDDTAKSKEFESKSFESQTESKLSGTEFLDQAFFPQLTQSNGPQINEGEHYQGTAVDYFRPKSTDQHQNIPPNFESSNALPNSSEELYVIDSAEYSPEKEKGFQQILNSIEPVWKYSPNEIVDLLAERVIYNGEDMIAFDKPYQLAYSGSQKAQMDRILQDLKRVVAPESDRLHLIKPLDKACTGVVLFAKNPEAQKKYMEMLKANRINFEYKTIVKNIPKVREAEIKVPVRKFIKGQDYELRPLVATTKEQVFYPLTTYRVLASTPKIHCSYLNVDVQNEIPHQIRCHLGYGIGCPILGDIKYSRIGDNFTQNLSSGILARLEVNKNQVRKLPMYLHLREIRISENSSGSKYRILILLDKFIE
uniref:Pseudouridine synthase RsuA/RluA-like domain-containing protein n=1 Tax=Panagrolaimus sp. PS1159 TaxID=55785 RepID=A0AC35FM51_9BILA